MTEQQVNNVMLEIPHAFSVDNKKHFLLYQPTLAKIYINAQIIQQLNINDKLMTVNGILEIMRIVKQQRDDICKLIAYNTFYRKRDVNNAHTINERANYFNRTLTDEDMTLLTLLILKHIVAIPTKDVINYLDIDKDKQLMQRVQKAKKNNNTYAFGGKSIYGALIGSVMEKYHVSYESVLWGISYANLQLLMADTVTTIYLTDEERKNSGLPSPNAKTIKVSKMSKEQFEELKKRFR